MFSCKLLESQAKEHGGSRLNMLKRDNNLGKLIKKHAKLVQQVDKNILKYKDMGAGQQNHRLEYGCLRWWEPLCVHIYLYR